MSKIFDALQPYLEKGMALSSALTLMEWDMETLAPEASKELTSKVMGILSEGYFTTYINQEVKALLLQLEQENEITKLNEKERGIVKQLRRLYDQLETIPSQEYKEYSELTAMATNIWVKAKTENNFQEFAPTLKQIIQYKKKFAGYRVKGNEALYDILLSDYEPDFSMEQLEGLFHRIKVEILPILKRVLKKNEEIDKSYNGQIFDIEKQREFCNWIAEYIGFDFNKGVIAESAHPFTTNLHNKDVRITNHFYKDNLESAIFSVIHETGHAIYEMNVDDQITQTLIGTGASMGMHESQSRFYENVIGRSLAFWQPIYPKLVEKFTEQLRNVTLEDFIKGINKVTPGLIRTEADEITYPLHILIRYEIEKMIFANEIEIEDIPRVWDEKYEEYLGIHATTYAEGVLQDVHWSCGDFGYFPSYIIGSAVAAQIYYHMKSIMPFEDYLREGNLLPIQEWLKENIHKYGMMKTTNEILKDMMKEEFNPEYYIRYLKERLEQV